MFAVAVALLATTLSAENAAKIDKVFAEYDHSNTPGCTVAVVRGGAIAYSRGYGMADLDHDVIITPATRFDAGSLTKQFTAAAILQLAGSGKLSLDDDVRKYVPEVPDYGAKITIRHLLHHTSGLHDLGDIYAAHGIYGEDLTSDRDGFFFLARQKELNFPPGSDYRYSNTGYWLLAMIAGRVSGRSFRELVRDNVFAPAGMTSSDIRDDHRRLFHNRAAAYDPSADGFNVRMTNWEGAGPTGLITTSEDLARWTINGQRFIEPLLTRDSLTTGETPAYAFGQMVSERGAHRRIEHGGATAGYRSYLMMLPDDDLNVAVMCNIGSANVTALADGVADAILGEVPSHPAGNVPAHADGLYVSAEEGNAIRLRTKDGQTLIGGAPLLTRPDGRFQLGRFRIVELHPGSLDMIDSNGHAHRYVPAPAPRPVTPTLAGRYHSDEAATDWTISVREGKVYASSDRLPEVELKPLYGNAFDYATQLALFIVEFEKDAFTISDRGVYKLRFTRVK